MKQIKTMMLMCALAGALGFTSAVAAAEKSSEGKPPPKDIVLKGDAVCTQCHDEVDNPQQLAIGKTKHGVTADKRNPTCTSCHGESQAHVKNPQGTRPRPKVDVLYKGKDISSADARSGACLTCHQGAKRIDWQSSQHATRDVACNSCHKVHSAKDTVRDKISQADICFTCHKEQRAQVKRPSRHPILEGKVACSDCHNPHGSAGPKMMVRDSVNDTCYSCHMEKRGPFLWNHQPVTEDCSICHNPHGSVNSAMLKQRPPYMCQQCHEATSHRGGIPVINSLTSTASALARSCMNCHNSIHGGSNPTNDSSSRTFRR